MGLTKQWLNETQELTSAERIIAEEIEQQAQGNYEDAIRYAAKALQMARAEEDRLTDVIKRKRLEIQRLTFPGLYPPDLPHGQDAVAERIYETARHMVELMKREGMQENFDVTYNSLAEIAKLGESLTE
jgi:hypothetical protein